MRRAFLRKTQKTYTVLRYKVSRFKQIIVLCVLFYEKIFPDIDWVKIEFKYVFGNNINLTLLNK
jgi:hypothetical protein